MQPIIQCGFFKGKDRAYFVDRREFDGPIQNQVDVAYQYVLEKINMGMQIHGIYRQDVYELPTDSVRELIANAVAHRSYLEPGNIQVAIFDDRLEVTSPGMLLNNVLIKKMIEGYSKPRNPAIANAFAYMKIIEKWETGIPRIFRECRDYGLPDPELIDFDGDFRVNMYRNNTNKASNESLNSDEAVIMAMIKTNPQISQKEMVTKSGFSRSKIQRILKALQGKKVLYREGARKNGYWRLILEGEDLLARNQEHLDSRHHRLSYDAEGFMECYLVDPNADVLGGVIEQEACKEIIEKMNDRQRYAVTSYYVDKMPQDEIGKEMGMLQQAVAALIMRTVTKIK